MRRKRYGKKQIVKAIKSYEEGRKIVDICQELNIVYSTFYDWLRRYDGLEVKGTKRLRDLEAEHDKLKKLLAESEKRCKSLQETLSKKVLKPAQLKQIVKYLVSAGRHSVRDACILVGLGRSTYCYKPRQRINKDIQLEAALLKKAKQYPRYSCAKLHELIRKEGLAVSIMRTYRLYKKHGLRSRHLRRKETV